MKKLLIMMALCSAAAVLVTEVVFAERNRERNQFGLVIKSSALSVIRERNEIPYDNGEEVFFYVSADLPGYDLFRTKYGTVSIPRSIMSVANLHRNDETRPCEVYAFILEVARASSESRRNGITYFFDLHSDFMGCISNDHPRDPYRRIIAVSDEFLVASIRLNKVGHPNNGAFLGEFYHDQGGYKSTLNFFGSEDFEITLEHLAPMLHELWREVEKRDARFFAPNFEPLRKSEFVEIVR